MISSGHFEYVAVNCLLVCTCVSRLCAHVQCPLCVMYVHHVCASCLLVWCRCIAYSSVNVYHVSVYAYVYYVSFIQYAAVHCLSVPMWVTASCLHQFSGCAGDTSFQPVNLSSSFNSLPSRKLGAAKVHVRQNIRLGEIQITMFL